VPSPILNITSKILSQYPDVVAELSRRLRLPYLETKDSEGNVCYMNSEEVRPEFREIFTTEDVAFYLIGFFKVSSVKEVSNENFHLHFPYPENADAFWSRSREGKNCSKDL